MTNHLPNLDASLIDAAKPSNVGEHKPRILLLYGSTRERSFSRLLVEEAARLLEHFGAETRIFNPSGLPLPDDVPVDHPKVQELRDLVLCRKARSGARQNATARCPPCSKHRSTGSRSNSALCARPKAKPWR